MKKYNTAESESIDASCDDKKQTETKQSIMSKSDEEQSEKKELPEVKQNDTKNEKKDEKGTNNADSNSATEVPVPQKYDILCGKDKACVTHEGSRHFRTVIDSYHERYQKCTTKQEKMDITKEIVEKLQTSTGSRFLKFNSEQKLWQEISQMAARDKVSHALRFASQKQERQELRKQNKNKKKKKLKRSSISSTCSSSSAISVTSENGTKATTKAGSRSLEVNEEKEQFHTPKRRRISDPLPFANAEDAKLWDQFVKRQQKLLLSIQRGELSPKIEEESDHTRTPSPPPNKKIAVVEACQSSAHNIITPPPLNIVETYPMDEVDDDDDDITDPIPVVETSDDIEGIMQEPLAEWGNDS